MHEAFCLDAEQDIFKPYEKKHSTVKSVCENLKGKILKILFYFILKILTWKTEKNYTLMRVKNILMEIY